MNLAPLARAVAVLCLSLGLGAGALAKPASSVLQCIQAQAGIQGSWRISSVPFGAEGSLVGIPQRFRVLSWNVFKNGRRGLTEDLTELSQQADLALLQEAVDRGDFVQSTIKGNPSLRWSMAKAFEKNGVATGVAIGSAVRPIRISSYRSLPTEPVLKTPKSMMLSEYPIANSSEKLLVLNVHAINFVGQGRFELHVDQMLELIQRHQGPLLVAGDFNTWSSARLEYLNSRMASIGLERVEMARSSRLVLDHVFTRGLRVLAADEMPSIRSSDHKPIFVELEFEPSGRR